MKNHWYATVRWLLLDTLLLGTIYYGIVEDVDGARRLFYALVWGVFLPVGLVMSFADKKALARSSASVRTHGRTPLERLNKPIDIAISLVCIWYGHVWTGIAFAISVLLLMDYMRRVTEYGKENP